MLKRIRSLPSPALAIAVLALIVAVGGGTFALARGGGLNHRIAKISNKVANKRITKRAPKLSVNYASSAGTAANASHADNAGHADNASHADNSSHADTAGHADSADTATNATTAANAEALGGKSASAFASSTVVRSVTVASNGTVNVAKSDGVTQANVSKTGTGFYCVKGLNPPPVTAVATIGFGAGVGSTIYVETNAGECQIALASYDASNVGANEPFALVIH